MIFGFYITIFDAPCKFRIKEIFDHSVKLNFFYWNLASESLKY